MPKLFIDPGHDPQFPGSKGEVEWVRSIVAALRNKGLQFEQIPDGLGGPDNLVKKIKWINERSNDKDTLISLHENSGGGVGNEVWYLGGSNSALDEAKKLAESMKKHTDRPDRGVHPDTSNRHKRLGIIRDTKPFALLIENGFQDAPNNADEAVGAERYANGIIEYLKTRGFNVSQPTGGTVTNREKKFEKVIVFYQAFTGNYPPGGADEVWKHVDHLDGIEKVKLAEGMSEGQADSAQWTQWSAEFIKDHQDGYIGRGKDAGIL